MASLVSCLVTLTKIADSIFNVKLAMLCVKVDLKNQDVYGDPESQYKLAVVRIRRGILN